MDCYGTSTSRMRKSSGRRRPLVNSNGEKICWNRVAPISSFKAFTASSKEFWGGWRWSAEEQMVDIHCSLVVVHYHYNEEHRSADAFSLFEISEYKINTNAANEKGHTRPYFVLEDRSGQNHFKIAIGFNSREEMQCAAKLMHACQKKVDLSIFHPQCTIGRGKFGKVVAAYSERRGQVRYHAVKEVDSMTQHSCKHIKHERLVIELLALSSSPFVVEITHAMKRGPYLYYVMELLRAGDLYTLLSKHSITLSAARIYSCEILCALEHLHNLNIVYRDLKPENILVDDAGHLKLADFGLSRYLCNEEVAKTCCGTESYTPPEMLLGTGYRFSVDFWQFGCLVYELFIGQSPFYFSNMSRVELKKRIINAKYRMPKEGTCSKRWKSIVAALITAEVADRLGAQDGWSEVKIHPFFGSLDWDAISTKDFEAPITSLGLEEFYNNFDDEFTNEDPAYSCNLSEAENLHCEFDLKGFDFQPHSDLLDLAAIQSQVRTDKDEEDNVPQRSIYDLLAAPVSNIDLNSQACQPEESDVLLKTSSSCGEDDGLFF